MGGGQGGGMGGGKGGGSEGGGLRFGGEGEVDGGKGGSVNEFWSVGQIVLAKPDYCWVRFFNDNSEVKCMLPASGYNLYWVFVEKKTEPPSREF